MNVLRSAALTAMVTLGLAAGSPRAIFANGQEFFPADQGPVDLVYFGVIKDAETGRPVRDHAYIVIRDNLTSISVPFTGDRPGHYRSPDIGAMIRELGEKADPAQIEITLVVPGYEQVKLTKLPRKASGAIEVGFKMEPKDRAVIAQAAAATAAAIRAGISTAAPGDPMASSDMDAAPAATGTPAAASAATSVAADATRGKVAGLNIVILLFLGAVILSAIVAVGRTLIPRATTGH